MNMKQITRLFSILICLLLVPILSKANVRDYPHNTEETVECLNCHAVTGTNLPPWQTHVPTDIDDTKYNNLCWSCHTGSAGAPPLAYTHSSLQTDTRYGDWSIECKTCHDPHRQRQSLTYGSASYLETGTSTGKTDTTLTDSSKNWANDQFAGMILFPDSALVYPTQFMYQIIGNTSNTITIDGIMDPSLTAGKGYAIVKGKLIKSTIPAPNRATCSIVANQYVCTTTTAKATKFFRNSGLNGPADADATYDGVCEVCHTQTNYHRNTSAGDHTHNAGGACLTCHDHQKGFKGGGCNGCHGASGSTGAPLIAADLVSPATGHTAGAHNKHVVINNITNCNFCHNGNGMPTPDNVITMAFSGTATSNGSTPSYDGTALNAPYSYSAGVTTATGTRDCSNVYCHSNVQGAGGSGAPIAFGTPDWGNAASVQCGSCHKSDGTQGDATLMDSGSHTKHVLNNSYACSKCHNGKGSGSTTHVNNDIDIAFDATNPSGTYSQVPNTPGLGYGTCSTTYCHGSGTPTWGTANTNTDCTWCHGNNASSATPMTIGNHTEHMNNSAVIGTNYECAQCHNATVSAGNDRLITTPANHANGTKNISIARGGTWTSPNCSSVYCHSSGKGTYQNPPSWGSATDLTCKGCHGTTGSFGEPDYASGGAGTANANSHSAHVAAAGDCSKCHTDTTTNGTAIKSGSTLHTNQSIDVTINGTYDNDATPGNNYNGTVGVKTCSSVSCHGTTSPQWGVNYAGIDTCTKCHGTPTVAPATDDKKAPPVDTARQTGTLDGNVSNDAQVGAHQPHMQSLRNYSSDIACSECHIVPATVNAAGHINDATPGVAEVTFGTLATTGSLTPSYAGGQCSTTWCHGAGLSGGDNPPTWNVKRLTGVAANDCTQCHGYPPAAVAAHAGKGPTDCITCHNHVNSAGTGFTDATKHVDGIKTVSADNCNDCHGNVGSALSGAHAKHNKTAYVGKLSTSDYGNYTTNNWYSWSNTGGSLDLGCGYCHPQAVATHNNGSKNVSLDPSDTGAAGTLKAKNGAGWSYTAGVCNQVYCHSNGNDDAATGVYGWVNSPNWTSGTLSGNCDDCHGNSPTTNSHSKHVVGIHYDTIYTGTTGLASAGAGATNSHGSAAYSTTINCNVCHNNTVTASANDKSATCSTAACHDAAPRLKGNMAIAATSSTHVNGTVDVAFSAINVKSKAQVRDNITTVAELNNSWDRTVSTVAYKASGAYDSAKNALNTGTMFNAATKTCSTVACHNGNSITWGAKGISCDSCHTNLTK